MCFMIELSISSRQCSYHPSCPAARTPACLRIGKSERKSRGGGQIWSWHLQCLPVRYKAEHHHPGSPSLPISAETLDKRPPVAPLFKPLLGPEALASRFPAATADLPASASPPNTTIRSENLVHEYCAACCCKQYRRNVAKSVSCAAAACMAFSRAMPGRAYASDDALCEKVCLQVWSRSLSGYCRGRVGSLPRKRTGYARTHM